MNLKRIALLTIGQSPRKDIIPEIKPFFSPHIEIVERGLLDNLTMEEIQHLKPDTGETPLVTILRDGTQVQLSEHKISCILPKIVHKIQKELKVKGIGVLCTHDFSKNKFPIPVIFPFDFIKFLISYVLMAKKIGVVIPLENQISMINQKWKDKKIYVQVKSPYGEGKSWREIARFFKHSKVEAIILDCIGYKIKNKQEIQGLIEVPILLPRTILALAINQIFGD